MNTIYFMDFIRDKFEDLQALERVFIKYRRQKRKKYDPENYKNIFEMIYLENINNLKNIFDSYIVWSDSYMELGFSDINDVSQIHYRWYNTIIRFQMDDGEILFEKAEYHPLQINFEGE